MSLKFVKKFNFSWIQHGVTKSGFTKDGLEYAKFKNIGLVELREPTNKDDESTTKEIEFGTLNIMTNIKLEEQGKIYIHRERERRAQKQQQTVQNMNK